MKSTTPDPSHFQPWKVAFRKNAHLLINAGYSTGRAKITTNEHKEEHITEFIVCGIKDWMRRSDRPSWCKYYSVHEEAPVSGKGSHGKSRPRTDIFIELGSHRERPEYVFEAKRLRANGFEAGKYTGIEGMGCFTAGIYAAGYDEAAMLGYVQSNTLIEWKKRVKKSIMKTATGLYLQSAQYDEIVIPDFPLEWVSEHERHNSKDTPVRIYHILLDCLPPEK
ncbi:MAG: hypothetical protein ACJ8AG_25000 [Ktedonobacteraceae bacterium]